MVSFSYYNNRDIEVEIHPSARRHGIAIGEIRHAVRNAQSIDDQEGDLRLYLGPSRSGGLIEVVTIVRSPTSELAIDAMRMRADYLPLLLGD